MDAARAAELTAAWVARHRAAEQPGPEAVAAVRDTLLARVPDPLAAAALEDLDGRRRIAALAPGAVFLAWAVPGSAGVREAARCRRIPLAPARTIVEVSERRDQDTPVRHWWFELEQEPLIFRTVGEDDAERFARALAGALGWSH